MKKETCSLRRIVLDTRGDTGFVEWVILVGVIALLGLIAFSMVGESISNNAANASGMIDMIGGGQ
jgi:Flp pilus assembly pilin Flp